MDKVKNSSDLWSGRHDTPIDLSKFLKSATEDPQISAIKSRSFEIMLSGGNWGDFDRSKPSTVLDCGCGIGDDAIALASILPEGSSVVGIDFNDKLLNVCKKNLEEAKSEGSPPLCEVSFQHGDLTNLSFKDDEFDYVRCDRVLLHIRELEKAVVEMIRVCKPGGKVMISEGHSRTNMILTSNNRLQELWSFVTNGSFAYMAHKDTSTDILTVLHGEKAKSLIVTDSIDVEARALLRRRPTLFDPGLERLKSGLKIAVSAKKMAQEDADEYVELLMKEEVVDNAISLGSLVLISFKISP